VNNAFIERNDMTYAIVDGWWSDAGGSSDALLRTNILVASQYEGDPGECPPDVVRNAAAALRKQ
jgi:hypothetical protein